MERDSHDFQPSPPYTGLPLILPSSIRLLKLNPAESNETESLEIEMYTEVLDNVQRRFDALSYTWELESQSSKQNILVNGWSLEIGQNLYNFLIQLRASGIAGPLWADAICIDQSNFDEKSHQVRSMNKIYLSAKCTRSWLGNTMMEIADLIEEFNVRGDLSWSSSQFSDRARVSELLHNLLDHRYWTRTWILQELILADEVMVHCCSQVIQWSAFVILSKRICAKLGVRYLTVHASSPLMQIETQKSKSNNVHRNLPQLVEKHGSSQCSNYRDRVFAMIGLIKSKGDPLGAQDATGEVVDLGVVDYTLTLLAIFLRLIDLYRGPAYHTFPLTLWRAFELDLYTPQVKERGLLIGVPVTAQASRLPTYCVHVESFSSSIALLDSGTWIQIELPWVKHTLRAIHVRLDLSNSSDLQHTLGIAISWDPHDNADLIRPYAEQCCSALKGTYLEHKSGSTLVGSTVRLNITFLSLKVLLQYLSIQADPVRKPLIVSANVRKNQVPTTLDIILNMQLNQYRTTLEKTKQQLEKDQSDILDMRSEAFSGTAKQDNLECHRRVNEEIAEIAILQSIQHDPKSSGTDSLFRHYLDQLRQVTFALGRASPPIGSKMREVLGPTILMIDDLLSEEMASRIKKLKLENNRTASGVDDRFVKRRVSIDWTDSIYKSDDMKYEIPPIPGSQFNGFTLNDLLRYVYYALSFLVLMFSIIIWLIWKYYFKR